MIIKNKLIKMEGRATKKVCYAGESKETQKNEK